MFKDFVYEIADNYYLLLIRILLTVLLPALAYKLGGDFWILVTVASVYDLISLAAAHYDSQEEKDGNA